MKTDYYSLNILLLEHEIKKITQNRVKHFLKIFGLRRPDNTKYGKENLGLMQISAVGAVLLVMVILEVLDGPWSRRQVLWTPWALVTGDKPVCYSGTSSAEGGSRVK